MTGSLSPRRSPAAGAADARASWPARGPIARAVGFLVAPVQAAGPAASSFVPEAARVVVLGGADDAAPLAAALALGLRAADRALAALVAVWGAPGPSARGAATPGAARLAATLTRRGLAAHARGRLVWLPLAAEPPAAAGEVRRAAALVEGPLVTALAGPRPSAFDELVAEHDVAVVAADPATPLARAAVAALSGRGTDARACRPPRRGLPRALALAGIAAPRLDRALDRAVRGDAEGQEPDADTPAAGPLRDPLAADGHGDGLSGTAVAGARRRAEARRNRGGG